MGILINVILLVPISTDLVEEQTLQSSKTRQIHQKVKEKKTKYEAQKQRFWLTSKPWGYRCAIPLVLSLRAAGDRGCEGTQMGVL